MAGTMYYQGVPPGAKQGSSTGLAVMEVAGEFEHARDQKPQKSINKVMAWDDGSVGLPGDTADAGRAHPAFRKSHVSFSANNPHKTSEKTGVPSQLVPADASAFKVSSPGDISPFSLTSSRMTAKTTVEASVGEPEAEESCSAVEAAPLEPGFIAPITIQVGKLSSKPGRPALTLKIPDQTVEFRDGNSALSDSSEAEDSQISGKTTPILTPAHAKRFPAQAGTRAAKAPKKVTLSDELGAVGEILSGTEQQAPSLSNHGWKSSIHDWAHEKHRYTSPESSPETNGVASHSPEVDLKVAGDSMGEVAASNN
ncbi:MAG: hypothetical protein Q9218_006353 [Villophora microphyllina]